MKYTQNMLGPLNEYIEGDRKRYFGGIYVAELTGTGEVFRIDSASYFATFFSGHI